MAATVTKSRSQYSPVVNINKSWISAYRARFASGDGATLVWPLPKTANTATITEPQTYYRTNWQGTQQLYSTARTNYCINSAAFNSWTANSGLAVVSNTTTSPEGDASADKLTQSGAIQSYASNAVTLASGTLCRFSVWLKNVDSPQSALYVRTAADAGRVNIVWSGAAITTITPLLGASDATFEVFPNGWNRVSFTVTTTEVNQTLRIYPEVGITGKSIYAFGCQFEGGSVATSYIPTTASAVTVTDYTISNGVLTLAQTTNPAVNQPVATNGGKGDGVTTAFTVTPSGTTPTLTALYKTDWQGKQLLYSTARTNLLLNSVFAGGGATPTSWTQTAATGTSAPAVSTSGGPGSAYLHTATAERPFFSTLAPVSVAANTTYTLSFIVESVTGALTASLIAGIISGPSGSSINWPVCSANPSGGSGGAVVPGILMVQLIVAGTAGTCIPRCGLGAGGNATGTMRFSHPQFEAGTTRTGFIFTTTVAVTVTDYTLVGNTATLSPAPAVGSAITWDGSYVGGLGVGQSLSLSGGYGSGSVPIVINGGDL